MIKPLYLMLTIGLLITTAKKKEEESKSLVSTPIKKKSLSHCQNKQGCDLKKCILELAPEESKKVLIELSADQRTIFFEQLSVKEYIMLLDNYNEYEWKRLFQGLSNQEKKQWPASVHEQRVAIAKIKKDAQQESTKENKIKQFMKQTFKPT